MSLVVKYGGSAMTEPDKRKEVALTLRALAEKGKEPVVVHGGGPFIAQALKRAGLTSSFVRGLRVTTAESLPVVEAALTGLGKVLAQEIGEYTSFAVGLTGRDSSLLVARPLDPALGFVGEMVRVNRTFLEALLSVNITPVIACLAENEGGEGGVKGVLNVNADSVAGAVAGALKAPVVFLTDVPGVLDDREDPASLLSELSATDIEERIKDGRIAGGMIPKVEAALEALSRGAAFAVIADGRRGDGLERAFSGEAGTRIYA